MATSATSGLSAPLTPSPARFRRGSGNARRAGIGWLLILGIAVIEVFGHFVILSRVPPEADWARAAEHVRSAWRERDLVVSAPRWTDPLLRQVLGDRIAFSDAGRSDLAAYERLWVVSIRGADAEEAPRGRPAFERAFGRVRVRRWDLGASEVLYDFVTHVEGARVTWAQPGAEQPCPFRGTGVATGGGLGAGAMTPARRHVCDPRRPWLWVGATVTEDLDLRPRYCIWQHPAGTEPIVARFESVPLGERMVLYGGLYYEHERMREHGPIEVNVRVDGVPVGHMTHRDGDGWKRIEMLTRSAEEAGADPARRGTVTVEVIAPNPQLRTFCWAGTTRTAPRQEEP